MTDIYTSIHRVASVDVQNDKRHPDAIWTTFLFKDKDGLVITKIVAFDCPDIIRLGDKT